MILIADSGSTKTDWVLIHTKHDLSEPLPQETFVSCFHTQGINPVYMSEQDIVDVFNNELKAQFPSDVPFDYSTLKVRFYGAGCREDMIPKMQSAFARSLHTDDKNIEVYSDMMGAARALCGNQEGIACILGTGSNSCLYDGQRIVSNISPMGFILGDEGSGAVLGKCFLNLLYKGEVCQSLKDDFIQQTQLSRQTSSIRYIEHLCPIGFWHHWYLSYTNIFTWKKSGKWLSTISASFSSRIFGITNHLSSRYIS